MSFRRRMVLLAAGAVAAAVAIASVVVYVVTRDQLRRDVDTSLRQKLTPGPDAVQLIARDYVHHDRRDHHGGGDRAGGQQDHATAKAHVRGAFST